ncbi:cellobiose transport system permease protein [Hamadaea flava]|uniref:Carbohydrate ABC transporter permease n=1 Tax=Hamadaea flava TaxID=1742688 RepID=A0ABV8LYS9_9ACTN|nr:sugar ABC transporter permease [Hamadaea flava]MCP2324651.1 cellobiose transport system permease protein [Hamadaea flava]
MSLPTTTPAHSAEVPPQPGRAPRSPSSFLVRASRWSRLDTKASPYVYIAPFFVIFGIFGLFPLIYTGYVALNDWEVGADTHTFVGLDNFVKILSDNYFWNAVFNTIGIFVVSTIPQLLLALMLANALNKRMRGRMWLRMGVLVPNITSVAAVAILFSQLFARDFGLINWLLHFVGVSPIDWQAHKWTAWLAISTMVDWRWMGYNALIYLAAMQSIPKDIYESAALDGASSRRQFWSITVPMLRPTIIFTVIISTIGGFQLYAEPLLFTGGASAFLGGTLRQSQTVTMYLMEQFYNKFEYGDMAAVAWLLFFLILIFSGVNYLITARLESSGKRGGKK